MGRKAQRRRADRRHGDDNQPDVSKVSRARAARRLRADIANWMENPSAGPTSSFMDGDPSVDPVAVSAVLLHWLAGAREQITQETARQTVAWLSETLGIDEADIVYAAGIIGHPSAPSNVTFNDGVKHYGGLLQFTLYMLLLNGALVATAGQGNPEWFRQFD